MFDQGNNKETLGEVFFERRKRETKKVFYARNTIISLLGGLKKYLTKGGAETIKRDDCGVSDRGEKSHDNIKSN